MSQEAAYQSENGAGMSAKPPSGTPQDKSQQYRRPRPATGEIGVYIDYEAAARTWVSVPVAAWLTVLTSVIIAFVTLLGATFSREVLTVAAVAAAIIISFGLPRTIGAPAPRYSSLVSVIFSVISVIAVRVLDDLYIAGIVCAISVVGAFIAEMARQDGRGRLVDSVAATVLTTVAATCSVALVGLAPHGSWKLALVGAAVCVAGSMLIFQCMRLVWPGAQSAYRSLNQYEHDTARWQPNTWSAEGSDEYTTVQSVTYYWTLSETARTLCVVLTGILGGVLASSMYATRMVTGRTNGLMLEIATWVGEGIVPPILVGVGAGLLCGAVVQLGNRIIRPTNPRVSFWGAVAWGVLPTVCMALPTYALVRISGA